MRTIPSSLALPRSDYDARLEALREHDLFLGMGADCEWATGVSRVSFNAEYDPALNEAVTCCLVGEKGPVFSAAHSLWSLESGAAMLEWGIEEYRPGSDALSHLHAVAEAAGWRDDRPIYVPPPTPFRQVNLLREAFPGRELVSADSIVLPLRSRKAARELEIMREAARKTVDGIRSACGLLQSGVTRLELFQAIRDELLAQGLDDVVYGPDCWAIGPSVFVEWTTASTRNRDPRLEAPCSVSLDVGASLHGYRSDVGRTIFVGEAPPRSAEALEAIREARAAGAPLLRAGIRAHEVDDATRAVISARGFGAGQWIPSGHGIGLELHEPPVLGEADETVLEDGNVCTFELAIWQDGVAGAFAEDTIVIGADGPDWLVNDGGEPIVIA